MATMRTRRFALDLWSLIFLVPSYFRESPPNPVSPQPTTPHTLKDFIAYALQHTRLQPYVAAVLEKGVGVTSINANRISENLTWRIWSSDHQATAAARIRTDVERLEDKAVSVASMNTSVAEVNSVYEEIQAWLGSEDNKKQEGEGTFRY